MSLKGLEISEALAEELLRKVRASFRDQLKELKAELDKTRYLLDDANRVKQWASSPASKDKKDLLLNKLDETERLYITAGDTQAGRIFKERTKKELEKRLTNLKANEQEVKIQMAKTDAELKRDLLPGFTEIRRDGALREMYSQATQTGGFFTNIERPYLKDLITLQTKQAGSKTLGEYMNKLVSDWGKQLDQVFVKGVVRGDSYDQMAQNLVKGAGVTMGKAKLLVNTEANAIFNESVRLTIDDNPLVKGYRFRAVLDSHTSKICQEHDGEYIPKEDVKPGVNYPPLHPNCRSTITTVFVGDDEKKDTMKRHAKIGGKWTTLPAGTTYKEFKTMINRGVADTGFSQAPLASNQPAPEATLPTATTKLGQPLPQAKLTPNAKKIASQYNWEKYISPDDPRLVKQGNVFILPNRPSSACMLDHNMSDKISQPTKDRYKLAYNSEPQITASMFNACGQLKGARLEGLENDVKTAKSLEDKILGKVAESEREHDKDPNKPILTQEQVIEKISDMNRYTFIVQKDDTVEGTKKIMTQLESEGMIIAGLDNKWEGEEAQYRGVHLDVVTKEGVKVEVQIHDQETYDAKMAGHSLYEKEREARRRGDDQTADEYKELSAKLYSKLTFPKGIRDLKSFSKE